MSGKGRDVSEYTALIYEAPDGTRIELVCPWGDGSGNIPPPEIAFHGGQTFVYVGSEPT